MNAFPAAAPRRVPWWGNETLARAASNQSAALGAAGTWINEDTGPIFSFAYDAANGGTLRNWQWMMQQGTSKRIDGSGMYAYRNHTVPSTPPLAVYTDAPSAVIEVEEGAATPLQLSMVNMTCGAPPCTGM